MSYYACAPQDRLRRIRYMLQGTLCGDMMEEVIQKTMAPPEMVLTLLLTTISAVVQTKAKVKIPRIGVVPTSIYAAIEALTNERKSRVNRDLNKALRDWEHKINQEREQLAAASEEAEKASVKRKKSDKPKKPDRFQIIIKDSTGAGLMKAILAGNKNLYQDADEGKKTLMLLVAAMYCMAWSGDSHVVNRASESFVLENSCLSLCVMIQPGQFSKVLERKGEELLDSGFLGRTLFTCVNSTQGQRLTNPYEQEPEESEVYNRFYQRCTDVLESAQHDNLEGPPQRKTMEFEPGAGVRLLEFYNDMEINLGPGQQLEGVCEFVGKATENAGRLAANLSWIETQQCLIAPRWVEIAIELMYYFIDQAKARFGRPSDMQKLWMSSEKLLNWIRTQVELTHQGVTVSTMQRLGPSQLRLRDQLLPSLRLLTQNGLLQAMPRGSAVEYFPTYPVMNQAQVPLMRLGS